MFLGINTDGNLILTSSYAKTNPMLWTFLFVQQAWSISLEIMFYLIAPFLLRKCVFLLLLIIIVTFVIRFVIYRNGYNNDPWTYRFFPIELGYFLLGSISYHIYTKIKQVSINNNILLGAWVTVILWSIVYPKIGEFGKYIYLMIFAFIIPLIFILTKKSKIDMYIGNLSYPMYISHIFIYIVVRAINIPFVKNSGIKLTLMTLIFSILMNELFLKKIEIFRQRRLRLKSTSVL